LGVVNLFLFSLFGVSSGNRLNIGRDTDCKAYIAGGFAGAMRGVDAWGSPKWVATELSEGLYKAAQNEHARAKVADGEVDTLLTKWCLGPFLGSASAIAEHGTT